MKLRELILNTPVFVQFWFLLFILTQHVTDQYKIYSEKNVNGSLPSLVFPNVTTQPVFTPNSTIKYGTGCGKITVRSQEIYQIQSTNFNSSNYFNKEGCTWLFKADNCFLSASCPCFDIEPSWHCISDYLFFSDLEYYNQKFCGDLYPIGNYQIYSGYLKIKFRTDLKNTATGFMCFIQCTPAGLADQMYPNVTCPTPPRL